MLLEKDKSNTIEILISKSLINSYVSHDEFVSLNNVLREYNEIKEVIKNPEMESLCGIYCIKTNKKCQKN